MWDFRSARLQLIVVVLLLTGCQSKVRTVTVTSTSPPPSAEDESSRTRFPTKKQLLEVAKHPIPAVGQPRDVVDVASWELAGPFPDGIGDQPIENPTRWETAFAEAANGRAQMTDGMRCVAREAGRFFAKHRKPSSEDFDLFVAVRCGAPIVEFALGAQGGTGSLSEEEVFEHLGPAAVELAEQLITDEEPLAGIAYIREGDEHLLVAVAAAAAVELEPVNRMGAGDEVAITGVLPSEAELVFAYATTSSLRAERCVGDFLGADFTFDCPVSKTQDYTLIEVGMREPGRVLSRSIVTLMVSADEAIASKYTRPDETLDLKLPALPGDPAQRLLTVLNAARTDVGLEPLREAEKQSATFDRLAPHYFASQMGTLGQEVGDLLSLGLIAGWDVKEGVHYGGLTSAYSNGKVSTERMLASTLSSPLSRSILMEPGVSVVALGVMKTEGATAALIGTYSVVDERTTPAVRVDALWQLMEEQRKRSGQRAPKKIKKLEDVSIAARTRLEGGRIQPRAALKKYLEDATRTQRESMGGFVIEIDKLEDFQLPKELQERAYLELDLAVARYQRPGEPWTRYVVMVVFPAAKPA